MFWAECSYTITNAFEKGDRVELHPATDAWMMGDKYGNIVHTGSKYVWVLMDHSNKIRKVAPSNIGRLCRRGA